MLKQTTIISVILLITLKMPILAQTNFSLQKALQTARANNPILKVQNYNLNIAESDIVTSKLRPNPSFNNQSLFLSQSGSNWGEGQNQQIWFQVTKPIQLPEQRRNKIAFAEQSFKLSQKNYHIAENSILSNVASKWLDVWLAQKELQIVSKANANVDSLLTINKLRFDKQVITQTDLFRTQLLADQYALQIKTSQQNYTNEMKNLKFLLGIQDNVLIDTTAEFVFNMPKSIDSLLRYALTQRDDIQAINSTIEVSNTNIKLQKSLAYPQPELGFIYNPQNTVPYAGIFATIDIPIFSRNQGEIKKSQFIKAQAEENLKTVQQQIETDIQTAYGSYLTQQKNVADFQQILIQSEQILKNVKYSYLKGGTTIIDFLEAQRSWLDTQQQYTDNLFQYRKAYIQLLFASGLINQL